MNKSSFALSQSRIWFARELFWRTVSKLFVVFLLLLPLAPRQAKASDRTGTYKYSGNINFDLRKVPFSRFGSYLSISDMSQFQAPWRIQGVFLRTMHHGGTTSFQLQLLRDAKPIPFNETATPTELILSDEKGSVEICFQGVDRIRVRGRGVQLRLIAEGAWATQYSAQRWEVNTDAMKYMIWPIKGDIELTDGTDESGRQTPIITFGVAPQSDAFEGEIDAYTSVWQSHESEGSFDDVHRREELAYLNRLKTMPSVNEAFGSGAELAAYVNWESVVSPSGNLRRNAMLMSKNWMSSVWSWDQAFNSMATSLSDPKLALDQFLLPFDVQDKSGAFPDKWDADSILWAFSKPPIHGWALSWLIHHGDMPDKKSLAEIYQPLSNWTEWYFRYRDTNGNGIPEYRHGNESGWDNSTVFIDGGLIESPDLSAYLVIQMETLSDMARILGKPDDARSWKERSQLLLNRMIKRFWTGHEFVAFRVRDGVEIRSKSLLLCMPIILGDRLPVTIRNSMVADLKKRAEQSSFGLPTEPPDSPFYESDGYWRGPIWAPSTMIIAEGLDSAGEHEFANTLRKRFCQMAQKSGMAENFDALSGSPLRDPAYTWTSSVYLIFAHELAKLR